MKDGYIIGLKTQLYSEGEKYGTILRYFFPELVTALLLYAVLSFFDSICIAELHETATYATSGLIQQLFHFLTKVAEGFSIGTLILCGNYNGSGHYKQTGEMMRDAFWASCLIGSCLALGLYLGSQLIYSYLKMPAHMIDIGVSVLRLRSLTVLLNFIFFALIGFMRGIKNTRMPMLFFITGGVLFIFFDYALVLGNFGFPKLGFLGSAMASVIQYGAMLVGALAYCLFDSRLKKYMIMLFQVNWKNVHELIKVSTPIAVDKGIFAACYIWLGWLMCSIAQQMHGQTGTIVLASYSSIKNLAQIAILPGIALAQVITLLVSNDYRAGNWMRIKNNIKKVVILSTLMVGSVLLIFSLFPIFFMSFFDKENQFTSFAVLALPALNLFVFFDLIQLLLSGALRGATQVKTVMWVRLCICLFFFVPLSYYISLMSMQNPITHFTLLYSSLYSGHALMSLAYLYYLRTEKWKKIALEGSV